MQWNLIMVRRKNKLTQADMAKVIGVTEETYRNKENGITQFKMDEMFLISNRLKKPLEEIFLPSDYTNREELVNQ